MTKASDIQSKVIEFLKKNPDPEDDKFHKFAETIVKEHDIAEEAAYEIIGSLMSGGKSKGKDTKVDPKELAMGIKVEVEHTNNKDIAEKIARDHLSEIPDYYTRLNKMEKEADKPMKKSFIKIYDNMYVMLEKAKYKKRTPDGKGGWKYEYYEPKGSKNQPLKDGDVVSSDGPIKREFTIKKQSWGNQIVDKKTGVGIGSAKTMDGAKNVISSFLKKYGNDEQKVEKDFSEYLDKQSPMQKANYKYIKRLPKPNGKGYIYFYNQQQVKDYKEKGIEPGGKKEKDEKKGLLSGIMSFFGFKSEKQAQEKIKETYEAHKEELKGVGISTFAEYMNEYLSNKEKWDKKFAGKSGEKKEKSEKKEEKPGDKKTVMSDKKKPSWNMSLMKKVAGIVGGSKEPAENIPLDPKKVQSVKMPKEIKQKGLGSKEYKEWVRENWASTPKPKLSVVEGGKDNFDTMPEGEVERTSKHPDVPTYAEAPEGFKKVEGTTAPLGYEFYSNGSPLKPGFKQVLVKDPAKDKKGIMSGDKKKFSEKTNADILKEIKQDFGGSIKDFADNYGRTEEQIIEKIGFQSLSSKEKKGISPTKTDIFSKEILDLAKNRDWENWLDESIDNIDRQIEKKKGQKNYKGFVDFLKDVKNQKSQGDKSAVMSAGINDSEIKKNLDQYSPKMNSAMELMQEYEKAKKDGDVNKMIAIQSLVSEFIEDKSKSREENIEILGKIVENLPTDKQIDNFARGRYSTQTQKKGNQILRDRYEKLSNVKTTSDKGLKKYSITDGDYAGSAFYKGDPKEVAKSNTKQSDIIDSKIMNPERFYADNIVEQGQWTNSRIAIFDKKVADKLNEQSRKKFKDTDFSRKSELQMDQIKPKNLDNYSDATFSYAKGSSDEKGANMIYENQDGEKSMYNASFIDLLQKNFPNGKLMTPKDGGMSPATWVENGEIKAVVMPIMNSEEQFKGMEEVANGLTGKDDFEKQKEKAQSGDSSDPTAEINLQNEDGSYKKRIPYTKIDKKKFKDEKEKKFFDKVKIKDPISSQDDIKPAFKHNLEAQKEGVWTDGKSLILDKQVTDDIYEKHNQNLLLKEIAKGKTYEEAMNVLKDRQDSTYMDYKRIIPKDSDISSKNAQFTGNYDLASNKYGFNKMEYSDGDTTVYMNADNVALMKDRFPNATMHITGQMSPVVFKEGGKIKGLVQPIDQRQIKNLEKLEKARQSANLLLSEFQKAKKMPIGTVNKNGYTKIAEGKWVKKGGKQAPKEEKKPGEKPGDDKKKEEKPKPTDERKEKLKSVLKKVASIFADALSMKDTVPATGQTVEETGENIKKKTEQKKKNPEAVKPEQKKPENTKKPKQENK